MTFSIAQIRAMYEALSTLNDVELPAKTSFNLAKLTASIQELYVLSEKSRQDLIIKRFGVEDPQTGQFTVPEESKEKFHQEWATILNSQEEIKRTPAFSLSEFDNVALPLKFFIAMGELICEE